MAIETDAGGTKYIRWTTPAGAIGRVQKSIQTFVVPDDFGNAYNLFSIFDGSGAGSNESNLLLTQITTGKVGFSAGWTGGNAIWITTSATLTAGILNHVGLIYDGSSTANDPIITVNGVSAALTELSAPSGTYKSGTSANIDLGAVSSAADLDGLQLSALLYSRQQTVADMLEAYQSRLAIPNRNGLVFAPMLSAAAGLTAFDGATLAAGNTIADTVSGALGVPAGSPVGRADNFLTYD